MATEHVLFCVSRVRWQGSEGRSERGMFVCDVAGAFAGVTSRGLPAVLIKIMSREQSRAHPGCSKADANTSAGSWEVGEEGAFICVSLCGRDVCLLCVDARVCLRCHIFAK